MKQFNRHSYLYLAAAVLFISLICTNITNAQAGSLDPAFGQNGLVKLDDGVQQYDAFEAVAVQNDGKIVAAGHYVGQSNIHGNWDIVLARFNSNGTPDPAFGTGGFVYTDIAAMLGQNQFYRDDQAFDLLVQPDGKIIIGGYYNFLGGHDSYDFLMVRYNSDGSLDGSFGTGGIRLDDLGGDDFIMAMALQTDDKIVVTGELRSREAGVLRKMPVVRYNSNGSRDASFGDNGVVIASLDGLIGYDLLIQPDGKIVAGGQASVPDGASKVDAFVVARFLENGQSDANFGVNGTAVSKFSNIAGAASEGVYLRSLALQTDGKIVAGGKFVLNGSANAALVRYNTDGSHDNSFGLGGYAAAKTPQDYSYSSIEEIVIQPDGRILAAGEAVPGWFMAARYNADGSPDISFGNSGFNKYSFGQDHYSKALSIALQRDGRAVLGGWTSLAQSHTDYALIRINTGISIEDVIFTNGGSHPLSYFQGQIIIPSENWPFAQFSLTSPTDNAVLQNITVKMEGSFTGIEGRPFRLYASDENNFASAEPIGADMPYVIPGQTVRFANLNDQLLNGTRYYWVTLDITQNYWPEGTIHGNVTDIAEVSLFGAEVSANSRTGLLDTPVRLNFPNQQLEFEQGSTQFITWDYKPGVKGVKLEFSSDGGDNWSTIADSLNPLFRNYPWTVPSVTSEKCLIRISNSGGVNTNDVSDSLFTITTVSGVENNAPVSSYSLHQNYPNPFNPATRISFSLAEAGIVKLAVYDILGRQVAVLMEGFVQAGEHSALFNAEGLNSGVYIYRIESGSYTETRKMTLMK